MPSVRVRDNDTEGALRRFRRLVDKAGVLTDLRKREFYRKPSIVRKLANAAAVRRLRKKLLRQKQDLESKRRH